MDDLETFWANMLGRDPQKIREVWMVLNSEEQAAVVAHLQRMVSENGWSVSQRISAQAALDALADVVDPGESPDGD